MALRFAALSLLLLATASLCAIAKPKIKPPAFPNWPIGPDGVPPPPRTTPPGPCGGKPPGPGGGKPPGPGGGGDSPPRPSQVFIVGGAQKQWSYGTNYTDWAQQNEPFYVGDVLEFKYDKPVSGRTYNHSVHLLRDSHSYNTCNLTGSLRIGNEYAGGGPDGFRFKIEEKLFSGWAVDPNVYIACGEKKGLHCGLGTMKFAIMPISVD